MAVQTRPLSDALDQLGVAFEYTVDTKIAEISEQIATVEENVEEAKTAALTSVTNAKTLLDAQIESAKTDLTEQLSSASITIDARIVELQDMIGDGNIPVPEISGNGTIGSTLTCVTDLENATFQWRKDGVDIVDATTATYVITEDDAESNIDCVVSVVKTRTAPAIDIAAAPVIEVETVNAYSASNDDTNTTIATLD